MLILSGQNARKKFIHHPLAFPTNVQKNLHQHNGSMQIFLNLIENFSFIYAFVTFLSGHQPMIIIQPVRVFRILGRLVEFLLPNVREELKDKIHKPILEEVDIKLDKTKEEINERLVAVEEKAE